MAGELPFEINVNPFKMHLADAILATHLAKEADIGQPIATKAIRAMLSRTAIVHAAFVFECGANCFLSRVPRGRRFRETAEKWPALEKYDLFLLSVAGSPVIPRDDRRVKAIKELIKTRDNHVHARSKSFKNQPSETAEMRITVDFAEKPVLQLPVLGIDSTWRHGVEAINAVLDFLRFFITLGRLSAGEVQATLSTTVKCTDGIREADLGNFNAALRLAAGLAIDASFLMPPNERKN